MKLSDMIVGKKYLVGDGDGYEIVTCLGPLNEKEFNDFFGESGFYGTHMKVTIHDKKGDYESIFFESSEYSLYIEPR